MNKTVCVTGGSGGIGQNLLRHLLESFHVKALFRKESATGEKWQRQGCQIILGDLRDEESLMNLVSGTEFVFHCAALINSYSLKEAQEVNVEGTRRLALAAAKSGCKRFIYISSIAVYTGASIKGKSYIEEVEVRENPTMESYCLTKLRSEIALKQVAKDHNLEYVILRPTCVYGPAINSYTTMPVNSIRKGQPVILGDGEGLLDVVYVDDVIRAILLAAHSPQANGEIFNVGGESIKCKDFYSYYGRMLQRSVRHISKPIVNVMVNLARINKEFEKNLNWYVDIQENLEEYPSTKAEKLLGYTPQFSLVVGMLKTELWLQDNRYIPLKRHVFRSALLLYSFYPSAAVHPTTEEEIVQIIQEAAQQSLKVRAVGAMHSIAPISSTKDVCIVLDKYKKLVNIEGSLVTVQAGMKIGELNEILVKHDLALPILGAIDKQTVSGAVATGTHGGSLYHKSLSGYVHALRIVRADGSVLEVDDSQHIFKAIVISMGLLGITSTITFKCVPTFYLESKSCTMPMPALLERFDDFNKNNKYVDIMYVPITDNTQVLLINPAEEAAIKNKVLPTATKTKIERRLSTFALKAWLHFFHFRRWNLLQRWSAKQYEGIIHTCPSGRSDLVFLNIEDEKYDPFPINNMEIAIPYSQAIAAITAIRNHFQKTQKYPTIYIHFRCSAQDDLWLSSSYGQAVCWIDFWEYPSSGQLFKDMVELLKPFNFRCHWGKQIMVDQEYIKQQYEKWHDFVLLRQEWDPNGMFYNSYLEKFFAA